MTKTREEIRVGQMATRFLLEGATSGGSVAVFEFDVTPGARLPAAHSHDRYEETIYGLAGVLTWTLEGQKHKVGSGEVLHIPRGAVHRFDNEGVHRQDARDRDSRYPDPRVLSRNRPRH